MKDFTYAELLAPGETGDRRVDLSLTARELAAIQLVISLGVKLGVGQVAYGACQAHGLAERFALEARGGQARVGLALADAFDSPELKTTFAATLASVDQERAALKGDDVLPYGGLEL